MRLRPAILLAALAFVLAAVPAHADPLPFCYGDPCVSEDADAGSGGVDAVVVVRLFDGTAVSVHAGPDAVLVRYGQGITVCTVGVDLDPLEPVFFCVF